MIAPCDPNLSDKVVIVGAACRLPGSDSLSGYWQNLLGGKRCVAPITRWSAMAGTSIKAGLLDDIDGFDAGFFRISPSEARCMDPQQRLLMETVQHAIEDCGVPVQTLRELKCGVFCTALPGDYKFLLAQEPDSAYSSHSLLGNAPSSLAGRVSYFYDFKGPSLSLDTACSSSLTALQIAVSQLRSGECAAALVAGVSVFATPQVFEFAQRANMLSPKGHCDAFGAQADGFVPAEGVAAVMLMSEATAQALGLEVLASIEAIGLNHDGMSNGMMAPNSQAQAELIASTYERFGIDVAQIGHVEAHGTGTPLGDAIEVTGLVNGFRAQGGEYGAYLGASKAVIGHTLVCSGLASLIKTLLIFRHRTIPGQLLAGTLNHSLDLDRFTLNEQAVPWPDDKRYGCVSAFGFTGSNAHLVLGIPAPVRTQAGEHPGPWPFLLSAQSPASLHGRIRQVLDLLDELASGQLHGLGVALGQGDQPHRLRLALVASTREELIAGLDACLAVPADQLDARHSKLEGLTDPVLVARLQSWLAGANVPVFGPGQARGSARVRLPGYPFDRKPYWAGSELEAATVPVVKCDLPQGDTLQRLRGGLAQLLGFDETDIDTQRSLQDYGVDSISLIQLLARFGPKASQIQPHDVFDLPSIAALAQVLQEGAPTSTVDAQVHGDVGLSMHWSQIGQGRGIVLLPPLNMSALAWMQQVNFLTRQGFALHIPSYPGHESSPFEEQGFGLEVLVSGIQAYLHQQFAGQAVPVVGWSLGGCLALALAARVPALVESMVLISTAARFGEDIFGKTIELNAELQTHADYLDILLEPRRTLVEQIGAGASMHTLSRYYQLLGQFDLSTGLSGIDVRTLIVHGEQDVVIADTDVQLLQRLPNARLEVVRDHGHFIPLTAARRFNGLLLDFIR